MADWRHKGEGVERLVFAHRGGWCGGEKRTDGVIGEGGERVRGGGRGRGGRREALLKLRARRAPGKAPDS